MSTLKKILFEQVLNSNTDLLECMLGGKKSEICPHHHPLALIKKLLKCKKSKAFPHLGSQLLSCLKKP